MYKNRFQGFTLIELLVVIAIIGILSAVVLASLGTARSKGVDAAVKSSLDSARAQAELFAAGTGNSYTGACAASGTATVPGLIGILTGAANPTSAGTPVTVLTTAGAYNKVTCHDQQDKWAADAPLSNSSSAVPSMWCVDSAGQSKAEPAAMAASAVQCI